MEVFFVSRGLQKACNDKRRCAQEFGDRAEAVKLRLSQLRGADNLAQFEVPVMKMTTRFHALTGDRRGHYAMDITANYRVVFRAVGTRSPLSAVQKIEILEIVDYH